MDRRFALNIRPMVLNNWLYGVYSVQYISITGTGKISLSLKVGSKNSENQDLFYPVTHFALHKKKKRID